MGDAVDDPIVLMVVGSAIVLFLTLAAYTCLASLVGDRAAVWIGCFVVVFLVESMFRVRQYADKSIDLQVVLKIVSWCYIFLFAVLRIPKYIGALTSAPRVFWMVFLAWALYTTVYSPNPSYSAVATFSMVAVILYFLALETEPDDLAAVLTVTSAIAAIAFVSIIVYFADPSLGRMSEWRDGAYLVGDRLSGIVGAPNAMGETTALGLVLLAMNWREIRGRLGPSIPLLFCGVCGVALVMSYSRTSMLSVAAILGINHLMRTRYLPWIALLAIGALVCILVLVPYSEQVMIAISRSGDASEIETGTTRAQIWDTVIKLADMRFWQGWGYASSVFILPNYAAYMGQTPPHAHNIVLQLWLTVGMIGVILFVIAFLAQVLYAAWRGDALSVSLLAFVIINGSMEPGAFAGIANMPTIALAMAVARGCRRNVSVRAAYPLRAAAA
jgi:exopolysaccharide production protein ExoQ